MSKVVILAGGRGSRMGDATDIVPKPMVKIGDFPIIEHIMSLFVDADFIIAAGYKKEVIESYFKYFESVTVVDTGINTQTGGRLKMIGELKDLGEYFYLCYGDGLTDYDLSQMELADGEVLNMLAVHPSGRFGELSFDNQNKVTGFTEKPVDTRWINGGFFLCHCSILDYIHDYSDILEVDVFPRILKDGKLYCTPYEGFWRCMDTPKDHAELNEEYRKGDARWLR